MLRLRLTAEERDAVQALRRDPTLTPAERDRVEMVCLAEAGWGAPAIAAHLRYNPVTVRRLLKRFPASGVPGLRRKAPGPAPDATRREQVEAALSALLDQDRTWTAAQLAAALADADIRLSAPDAQVSGADRGLAAHGAHAAPQAGPGQGRAGQSCPHLAQKKAAVGRIRLVYLDECGFAPSQPVSSTWVRKRERKRVPTRTPKGGASMPSPRW